MIFVYNQIFVRPLKFVTASVHILTTKAKSVQAFRQHCSLSPLPHISGNSPPRAYRPSKRLPFSSQQNSTNDPSHHSLSLLRNLMHSPKTCRSFAAQWAKKAQWQPTAWGHKSTGRIKWRVWASIANSAAELLHGEIIQGDMPWNWWKWIQKKYIT